MLDEPVELWQIIDEEGYVFGSFFPVAADLDNDGRVEYLIGRTHFETGDGWLDAINVEDGSILWRNHLDAFFFWSAPVIVDVNNDGQLDIVFGSARFAKGERQVMAVNGNDASLIWTRPLPAGGMGMTVADVNNDGQVEVIINDYGKPQMIYFLNGRDGNLIWQRQTGGSAYNIPAVGDINGDGRPEIVQHNHMYNPSRERLLVWDEHGKQLWTHKGSPSPEQEANAPPELGWVPDFGYVSATIADVNADGEVEIGWGSRCHYYLLNSQGEMLWRVPTCEGYGVFVVHEADGAVRPDTHGTGGLPWHNYASAVGNLDADPALEIVVSLGSEYRMDYYQSNGARVYDKVTPANMVWALDGKDGTVQWIFEGEYPSDHDTEAMHEPVLVDLTGDGLLDVLVLSRDNHLYAIHGATGELLRTYPMFLASNWYAVHFTFLGDGDKGIVIFSSLKGGPRYTLNALQIAQRVSATP